MLLQGAREQYIGIIDATEHAKMTMHQVTPQQMIMTFCINHFLMIAWLEASLCYCTHVSR